MFKNILYAFLGLLAILAIVWIAQGSDFFMYKFFAPKYENVRREVFENTYSYQRGTIENLRNEEIAYYNTKDTNQRIAMSSYILHDLGEYDESKLPNDLQNFVEELKRQQGLPQ